MTNITLHFYCSHLRGGERMCKFYLYRETKKSNKVIFDSDDFLNDLLVSRPEDFNIFSGKLKYF